MINKLKDLGSLKDMSDKLEELLKENKVSFEELETGEWKDA